MLETYAAELVTANQAQNLISAASLSQLWWRHIVDSAQLLRFVPRGAAGPRLDLGSGAGLPGLVLAILGDEAVTLVESRRLRAEFLRRMVERLNLGSRVRIEHCPVERLPPVGAAVIVARAFAPLDRLLTLAAPHASENCRWILPKGQSAAAELAVLEPRVQKLFHVEPSLTDPAAQIIVGCGGSAAIAELPMAKLTGLAKPRPQQPRKWR